MYYLLHYQLNSKACYLLWYSDNQNPNRVHVNGDGYIPVFISKDALLKYALVEELHPIDIEPPPLFNLDVIADWLTTKRRRSINCEQFLNAWNLLGDVSQSLNKDFDSNSELTQKIYSKIFWGSNIEALTPKGQIYIPIWTAKELRILRAVFKHGLQIFRNHVRNVTFPEIKK